MTRKLIELFRPLRSFAFISITAATIGGIQTSPCSAQGVWAEPMYEMQPACGTEIPCGVEAVCGAEIACGAEPVCGAEMACGCQRSYQHSATCGCESSGRGQLLGPEQGLLANAHLHRCGVIDGTLNMFAGGIKKIAALRPRARHASRSSCGCATCQHQGTGHLIATQPATCSHCQSHGGSGVPTVSAETYRFDESETNVGRDLITPTLAPADGPTDEGSTDGADQGQPGEVFDGLRDPFQDDSARHTASGEAAIQQATFDNEVPTASMRHAKTASNRDTDYADYFRK